MNEEAFHEKKRHKYAIPSAVKWKIIIMVATNMMYFYPFEEKERQRAKQNPNHLADQKKKIHEICPDECYAHAKVHFNGTP